MRRSLALVRSGLDRVLPERRAEAGERAHFEREMAQNASRNMRFIGPPLFVLHVTMVYLFARTPATTPDHGAWLRGLVYIHAALAVISGVGASLAWAKRTRERSARWASEAVSAGYIVACGLMFTNAQRTHPNMNMFVLAVFGAGLVLHGRPSRYLASLAAGASIVFTSIALGALEPGRRAADTASTITTVLIAACSFLVMRGVRYREHSARRRTEQLNQQLESRVEAQVREIVERAGQIETLNTQLEEKMREVSGRAREIDLLNAQLNEKVRERSYELSNALARLAERHTSLLEGTVVGDRVRIESLLGQGGMGVVYRGRDLVTDRDVAVKVVQAGSVNELESLHRFLREARALASLTHPAVVRSYHVDVSSDGRLFQVMELVEGRNLQGVLDRRSTLTGPETARLGSVLAGALASAHEAGIIHRDVKPANVMLTGATPGLKLLDFGISRLRNANATEQSLTEGQVIGTPQFLAPEQVSGPEEVDGAADVYALGLVLYLCVAGVLPFNADSARTWLLVHALQEPADLRKRAPHAGEALSRLIMSCLNKDPRDRPAAVDLARSLGAIADSAAAPPLDAMGLHLSLSTDRVPGAEPPTGPPAPGQTPAAVTGIQMVAPASRTIKAAR